MPTYVHRCTQCGHEFEVFSKMSAKPRARRCPVCGGRAERQITGGAGFLFKGEGFYITDYRSEEYRSKAKAEEGPGPGDGEAKAEKKEDSVPSRKNGASGKKKKGR